MSVFEQLAEVRMAQRRSAAARQQLKTPVSALLARGRTYPLTTVGGAAGAGFVLGRLNVHPLRVPGVGPLLSGGLAEAVSFGTRLIAELAVAGAAVGAGADEHSANAAAGETAAGGAGDPA